MKMPSRMDTSIISRWWWSIDQINLAVIGFIITLGIALLMAAGPVAAARLSHVSDFYFPIRQMIFLGPALVTMFAVSLLSPLQVRRLGVLIFLASIILLIMVLLIGTPINGAKRWLDIGPILLQPSEFAKTGFVIASAWMLAEGARDPKVPGGAIALVFYVLLSALLFAQPDFGQWMLVTFVWAVMFFIAGWSWVWIISLGFVAIGAMIGGYFFLPHVTQRVDTFLKPETGNSYQVDKAIDAISNGGLFGKGGSEAVNKHQLPDAHADFIFAVAGEEFGFFFCALIISLFAIFVGRAFYKSLGLRSLFAQCAVCGLSSIVGFQALINIGVNLRALPAKGMTLPFISYGGSSLIATAICVGFIFALTRGQGQVKRRREIMP